MVSFPRVLEALVTNAYPLVFTLGALSGLLWLGLASSTRDDSARQSPGVNPRIGGAVGALCGLGLYTALTHHAFWPLLDALSLPGAFVAASAWTGCLLDGCAYGRVTVAGSWTSPTENMFADFAYRWPTQTVGVLYSLLVLASLFWLSDRGMRDGVLGSLALAMTASGAFALSFTRSDPALLMMGFRLDTVGSAMVLLIAFSGFVLRSIKG